MSTTADVAFAFDTHKFVKQMIATGFTEEQAEAQVRLLSEILHTQLSTKADVAKVDHHVLELKRDIADTNARIATVEANLKRDIAALDGKIETTQAELKRDMKEMELRMVIKMGMMILASVGMIVGILRAFPTPVQIVHSPAQELRQPVPSSLAPAH
ncbi:MAG: CCDC90 family protein [Magnetococcus sp. MYC-9]